MTGDDLMSGKNSSLEVVPNHTEDEAVSSTCCNLFFLITLGLVLGIIILLLFLGFLFLGLFVMIPIEHWSENYSIMIQILVEIPLVIVFILIFPVSFYIIGVINRFRVEQISKARQPNNRRWTLLSGFIVYVIGMLLINGIIGFTMQIEHPESYWIGIVSHAVTDLIGWFCFFLVGIAGYLVAIKPPLFRDTTTNGS